MGDAREERRGMQGGYKLPGGDELGGGEDFHCGYAAIVGRPNVGKSTLLNALVGERISIVSAKPHTTRHRILGVLNRPSRQTIFLDTPGLQSGARAGPRRLLRRLMARAIDQAMADADVIVMLAEAGRLTDDDRRLGAMLADRAGDTVLVLNKIDRTRPRSALLPLLQEAAGEWPFSAFVPVSALRGTNVDRLAEEISGRLPAGPPLFPPEMVTDRGTSFRISEFIREKLLSALHQEVPYGLTVEVEYLESDAEQWLIHAVIWVERSSHKAIVIGKGGRVLKAAGQAARRDIIAFLKGRVHLELWVRVRERWADSERQLRNLGFDLS